MLPGLHSYGALFPPHGASPDRVQIAEEAKYKERNSLSKAMQFPHFTSQRFLVAPAKVLYLAAGLQRWRKGSNRKSDSRQTHCCPDWACGAMLA